ncbi:MAG: hypothetical protein MK111_18395 [Crocosphaera sp.]|uniref:hypothetical protein n=2 Tax=Crocosphaera sp. TaxID=2729996 RepID=UPI0025868326|nr:hypothetical protein [Crocosphaera sp.]MCH2246571.1 hypothetical protein [Crocosphaera sp.]
MMKLINLLIGSLLFTQAEAVAVTMGSVSNNTFLNLPTINVGTENQSLFTDLLDSDLARASFNNQTIFIGSEQVSANNQNPFAISFVNNTIQWFVDSYETGGADGRGVGLVWDGGQEFYAAFAVDGGGSGIESLTTNGWLNSYGMGGGTRSTVLARLDATTGQQTGVLNGMGTFINAILNNGRSNSLIPTGLSLDNQGNVFLSANSFFGPRGIDRTRMEEVDVSGGSPFRTLTVFDSTLNTAQSACAEGWIDPNTNPNFCAEQGFGVASVHESSPVMGLIILGSLILFHRRFIRLS